MLTNDIANALRNPSNDSYGVEDAIIPLILGTATAAVVRATTDKSRAAVVTIGAVATIVSFFAIGYATRDR